MAEVKIGPCPHYGDWEPWSSFNSEGVLEWRVGCAKCGAEWYSGSCPECHGEGEVMEAWPNPNPASYGDYEEIWVDCPVCTRPTAATTVPAGTGADDDDDE